MEGLKDLLLGPCVDLPLTAREPALSVEADSGSCPGVTANGEARTFNGSIELCRADSDSSQKDRNGNQLRSPQEPEYYFTLFSVLRRRYNHWSICMDSYKACRLLWSSKKD